VDGYPHHTIPMENDHHTFDIKIPIVLIQSIKLLDQVSTTSRFEPRNHFREPVLIIAEVNRQSS